MECEWDKVFSVAGLLGAFLVLAWVAAYFLSWLWAWTWAWIDDAKVPKTNPLIRKVMMCMGWEEGGRRIWLYQRKDEVSDGERGFLFPLMALAITPTMVVAAIYLYPLTIGAFTLYMLAKLARFCRRHKKLFDKHLKDPEAHK